MPGKGMGVFENSKKFRVRVWKCYRTSRSCGYCGTGIQNFQNFRSGAKYAVPVPRVLWPRRYTTSRSSRYGYEMRYRTSRSSGYRSYERPTEVTEDLCRIIPAVNTPGIVLCVPYRQNENRKFGYGYECRTELTDVPGNDRVVQNSQKSRVRVIPG